MVKLPKKYYPLLFGALISLIMSFWMSFFITIVNIGFTPDFLFKWIKAFLAGFLISFPSAVIAVPIVKNIVDKLTAK